MVSRAFKLRFRRRLRMQQRQVIELSQQAEAGLDRDFFRKLEQLPAVGRFVTTWVLLLVLLGGCMVAQFGALDSYFQTLQAVPGGTYTEGVVGTFTNANPIYASNPVDSTVSHLIFSGLFTYNQQNQLVGDLADSWNVDARGTTYEVHLRPNLAWQDGAPLTANDVAFTYHVIQDPAAQSPLQSSWRGVHVTALNAQTVRFVLPNLLSSFPYSLTNGIIPQHVLGHVADEDLRSSAFNTMAPVGAGPFAWQAAQVNTGAQGAQEAQIALKPFAKYHTGAPKLASFVVRAFSTQDEMVHAFEHQELTAMAGLSSLPAKLAHDSTVRSYSFPLTAAVMSFFNTSQGVLADVHVRQALVQAANQPAILASLGYPAIPVREPLLQSQLGFNPADEQANYDPAAASAALDAAGWKMGANGLRLRDGKPLSFSLYTADLPEYTQVARLLQRQWRKVGVDAKVVAQDETDFESTLNYHLYDALLYGTSIGVDPDVYVYWDSTQADVSAPEHLNFSEYKSPTADASLEAGRTRSDPALRVVKYQAFLQDWKNDAPALGLYQPRYLYVTHTPVANLGAHTINVATDRFNNVQQWMIRRVNVSQGK